MDDRRPALPVAIDFYRGGARVDHRTGELVEDPEMVFTPYDIGRFREGYCCYQCFEAQFDRGLPVAFPERCSACGFEMREKQPAMFAEDFAGVAAPLGPSRSIAELREQDEELKEKQRRRLEGRPTSSIWVPA